MWGFKSVLRVSESRPEALTSAPFPWGRSWSIMSILQVAKLRQKRLGLCRVMRPFRENERPSYSLWGTLIKLVPVLLFRGMRLISYLARMMAFVKPMLHLIFYALFLSSHTEEKSVLQLVYSHISQKPPLTPNLPDPCHSWGTLMLSPDFLGFIFSFLLIALGTLPAHLISQGPHQPRAYHLWFFPTWKSLPDMLMAFFLVPFSCQQRGLAWPPICKCIWQFFLALSYLPAPTYIFVYGMGASWAESLFPSPWHPQNLAREHAHCSFADWAAWVLFPLPAHGCVTCSLRQQQDKEWGALATVPRHLQEAVQNEYSRQLSLEVNFIFKGSGLRFKICIVHFQCH